MGRRKYHKKKILSTQLLTPSYFYKANWKMSSEQFDTVKQREKDLSKSKEEVIENAKEILGYDYTKKLACPSKLTIGNIVLPVGPNKQKCPIILENKMVNKLLKMKKVYLGCKPTHVITNFEKIYTENSQFYGGYDKEIGPILFYFVENEKHEYKHEHYSISLYCLINGSDSFELFRYDSKNGYHPQRFDENGKVTNEKVILSGPHLHKYDEKFTAIFPDSYCHYDVIALEKNYDKVSQQAQYIKN